MENLKKQVKKVKLKSPVIVFLVIIALVSTSVFLFMQKENKDKPTTKEETKYPMEIEEKLKTLNHPEKAFDYFKFDFLERYLSYQELNPNLSIEDIITRVNIGLDNKYYTNTSVSPYLNTNYLLVNKYISLGENYVPDHLVDIDKDCSVNYKTVQLVSEAKDAFVNLCHKAKEDGFTIRAMSSYRSYDYQKKLYQNYVDSDGVEEADTYSARPGFSEHQTGLTVDVDNAKLSYTDFDKTNEFKWMMENAHRFGFILRYPKDKEDITGYSYESWHYRYVGVDIATYIYEHNITLDEYYVRFIENKMGKGN